MRTIALFGATGKAGRRVVDKALAAGFAVRALVRDPARLTTASPNLTVVVGDVLDAQAVAETVRGSDAVISTIGHVKDSSPTMQTDAMRNIVKAMQAAGVTRLVSLTGGAVPDPHDKPKVPDRILRFLLKRLSPQVLDDAIGHVEVLRSTPLEWTVVRGPRLLDKPGKGRYREGWAGVNASTKISYEDLADFIVAQVDDRRFVGHLPFVSD